MKSKTMILMAVAVVCGLGASYMTSRLLAERGDNKPVEEEKVKVLVAAKAIPQGTYIKEPDKWFVEKEFIKGDEPKKAVRTFDEVKDRVLNKPLSAEQWVVAEDLLRKDQSGITWALPKGMRAMAIKVNVDTVVAGFVQPNSRVDIINTVRGGDKDSYSKTILQNMLVLAIDTIDTRDLEKKAIVSSTVTLAVTPKEAQTLSMAIQMGELRLVLRPPDDNEIVQLKGTKPDDVKTSRNDNGKPAAEEEPDTPKQPLHVSVPDVPMTDPMGGGVEPPAPVEPVKRKKAWVLAIVNGDSQAKATFIEGDDDFSTQIQKSDADQARPEKAPTHVPVAPEKPAVPDKAAPEPDKTAKPSKRQAGK